MKWEELPEGLRTDLLMWQRGGCRPSGALAILVGELQPPFFRTLESEWNELVRTAHCALSAFTAPYELPMRVAQDDERRVGEALVRWGESLARYASRRSSPAAETGPRHPHRLGPEWEFIGRNKEVLAWDMYATPGEIRQVDPFREWEPCPVRSWSTETRALHAAWLERKKAAAEKPQAWAVRVLAEVPYFVGFRGQPADRYSTREQAQKWVVGVKRDTGRDAEIVPYPESAS